MKTFTLHKAHAALFIFLFALVNLTNAQSTQTQVAVIREWVKHFAVQDSIMESPAVKDAHQNYYVAGYTWTDSTGADIVVVKYDMYGNQRWSRQFYADTCYCRDQATAICIDPDYSVYVTGISFIDSTNGFDYVTIKYDSAGSQQWVKFYNGNYTGGYDVPVSIVPLHGYVFVTGTSQDSIGLLDIVTIRYKGSNGNVGWMNQYDYTAHLYDAPRAMKAGGTRINVTGGSQNSYLDWDYVSLQYDSSGSLLSATRVNNSGSSFDRANAVALTDSGIAYITGRAFIDTNDYDIRTVKVNPSGTIQWIRSYDYNGLMDEATSIDVDADENIYITGYGTADSANEDYITLKYDSSGDLQWIKYFNGTGNGKDIAWDIDVDSIGTAYVTGESDNGNNHDFCTIAYQTTDGLLLWKDSYDGIGHCWDKATNVECDSGGVVYVSGQACINDSTYEYVTIKYYSRHMLIPPEDSAYTPSSFAYYENYGQIIDTDDSVRMDIKYYAVNHYPSLYFFEPDIANDNTVASYVFANAHADTAIADTIHRVDLTFEYYGKVFEPIIEKTKAFGVDKSDHGYLNYYLPQCPNGITGVKPCNRVCYPDAFFKTDIQFYGNSSGMKFYIIAKPDGGVYNVNLKFTGQDSLIVSDSTLEIVTSLGNYTYDRPEVFQIDSLGNRIDVAWAPEYVDLDSGRVGFALQSYYSDMPLVIGVGKQVLEATPACTQNNFNWSTYMGISPIGIPPGYLDRGTAIVSDDKGIYTTGSTTNSNSVNFPIVSGFQTVYGLGFTDCFITMFKHTSSNTIFPYNIEWCTYAGGNYEDYGTSIAVNNLGDVYVVGSTFSTTGFPYAASLSGGNFNVNTFQGVGDAFIMRIATASGILKWSSAIGGNSVDFPYAVAVNQNASSSNYKNVYVVGRTFSNTGFPIQASTASGTPYDQTQYNSGAFDAFIMRFDGNDNREWCSYFGGNGTDAFNSIVLVSDASNNVYAVVGGITSSTNPDSPSSPGIQTATNANSVNGNLQLCFPTGSPYYDTTFAGGIWDNLLVSFTENDELQWSTYFGGSGQENTSQNNMVAYGEYIYFLGFTSSSLGFPDFPLTTAATGYQQNNYGGGNNDDFIAEFDGSDFSQIWTTYFGGSGADAMGLEITSGGGAGFGGIAVDYNHTLYISGSTNSSVASSNTCAVPSTIGDFPVCASACFNPYSCAYTGTPDAFVAAFNSAHSLIWSTYMGANDYCVNGLTTSDDNGTWLNFVGSQATYNFSFSFPTFQVPNFYYQPTITNVSPPSVTGRFFVDCPIGITEANSSDSGELLIYPNPSQNILTFEFTVQKQSKVQFAVYDVLGKELYIKKWNAAAGKQKNTINVSSFSPGIYFVRVKTEKEEMLGKFVKE